VVIGKGRMILGEAEDMGLAEGVVGRNRRVGRRFPVSGVQKVRLDGGVTEVRVVGWTENCEVEMEVGATRVGCCWKWWGHTR
jgi:hypothetical protein